MSQPLSQPPPEPAPGPPDRPASGRSRLLRTGAVALVAGLVGGGLVWGADELGDDGATDSSSSSSAAASSPNGLDTASGRTDVEAVARATLPSVVLLQVQGSGGSGEGSGIVLDSGGEILTNNHVVSTAADGGRIAVVFSDGTSAPASIVGTDPVTDLAVVRASPGSGTRVVPARIGSSEDLRVGQQVVAVGAPLGLQGTVTAGIVSALNRPVSTSGERGYAAVFEAIQTDAAVNPGNSGGPLVDMGGRVIGINSAIASIDPTGSGQGGSIGLGFAIPISQAMPIVAELEKGAAPTHAQLGISVRDSAQPPGAEITAVEAGSSAAAAGLRPQDVVTRVDDTVVGSGEALVAAVRAHRPGDSVEVTYVRGSQTDTVTVRLGSDQGSGSG